MSLGSSRDARAQFSKDFQDLLLRDSEVGLRPAATCGGRGACSTRAPRLAVAETRAWLRLCHRRNTVLAAALRLHDTAAARRRRQRQTQSRSVRLTARTAKTKRAVCGNRSCAHACRALCRVPAPCTLRVQRIAVLSLFVVCAATDRSRSCKPKSCSRIRSWRFLSKRRMLGFCECCAEDVASCFFSFAYSRQ